MEDDLGVGGGAEDGPSGLELVTKRVVVDEVSVVGDGELAKAVAGDEGLDVGKGGGCAGGGVAVVADGCGTDEGLELGGVGEDLGDEAKAGAGVERRAVRGDDSSALLAAVLEGVQAQVAHLGRLWVADDGEYAALLAGLVVKGENIVRRRVRQVGEGGSSSDGCGRGQAEVGAEEGLIGAWSKGKREGGGGGFGGAERGHRGGGWMASGGAVCGSSH